jgi:electron transfer flavoprotein alpha subunit
MESILVFTHTDESGKALTKASLEAIAAGEKFAALLGCAWSVALLGPADALHDVGDCGAQFYVVDQEAFAQPRYATDAAVLETLCRTTGATIVLAPHSARVARVAAGVAHRLGGFIDTHITGFGGDATLTVSRWFYRQRIEAALSRTARPWFLLLEPGSHAPFALEDSATAKNIQKVTVELPATRTTVTGTRAPQQGQQTIRPDASLLFVAGAGWTKKQANGQVRTDDAARIILGFLNNSGASLGSSKSLVDQGGEGNSVLPFLTHMNQIGQTGATPRHPRGLATCCHGEEPHVVGWRFIADRRAISLDPNCGWTRGKADVVYIADAFEVMEKVNELLATRQQ